jgi:hypothetical protein
MPPFAPTRRRSLLVGTLALGLCGIALAEIVPTTLRDFRLSGTQIGDIAPDLLAEATSCSACHGYFDAEASPYDSWKGSLMALGGKDPLFFAQMTTAEQDVTNISYFCLRCHVPNTFATGSAYDGVSAQLSDLDKDGVSCHFCHTMVDPIYKPGISPPEDLAVLAGLTNVPQYYGNAMFVLDPSGLRRGPYDDALPPHAAIQSPFHKTGEFCGTCHDVGNVATARQPDGSYTYNQIEVRTPTEDLAELFPLERTYTEWKLSDFANGGVDMGGRFGGDGPTLMQTCQDCHMPTVTARGAIGGPIRSDIKRHDFAGASAWVLEIIDVYAQAIGDDSVDSGAVAVGKAKAVEMLQKAADIKLRAVGDQLNVRVVNQSGHKIPTGHIEGRRIWVNVRLFDDDDELVGEYGQYDLTSAHLDVDSTTVYEMHVGISDYASSVTGLPAGVTTHMSLANTIEKDNRIPPRGFNNAAYEAAGAPAVGTVYADGQHWHDTQFTIPAGAVRAEARLYYQTVTRHYIEALRDANVTDHWGRTLYRLWLATGKCAPILMTSATLHLE